MTNTIKELNERKSVRVYTDKEISVEDKNVILESAMAAPTAGNMQLYSIIDVQNPEIKSRLAVLCDNQSFINDAKMVLVFCADYKKWYDVFSLVVEEPRKLGAGDLMLSVSDACIAAQNTVVAAHSLGIGSCYIGDVLENCEEMRKCLNLPKYVFPCAMLVFGYPTEQQLKRPKPERYRLCDIVFTDRYEEKDESELREMFAKNCRNSDFDRWATAFYNRKYNSDFCEEMTRSVEEYLKDYLT